MQTKKIQLNVIQPSYSGNTA